MKRDFKSCMLYALFGLPIFLLLFIASVYVANCGLSADCSQADLPAIIHTPIPTLIPASLPSSVRVIQAETQPECTMTARDLLDAWVSSGYKETQIFAFRDIYGNICNATFADIIPLFNRANLWYGGALACDACHNSTLSQASAYLDLSSYASIVAGSKRTSPTMKGKDILGGGNWEKSILNDVLFVNQLMPFGRPPGAVDENGPTIQAGTIANIPVISPTQVISGTEIARPSNPGGPGDAINLTGDPTAGQKVYANHCQVCHGIDGGDGVANPGSDDGTIPPLNPIDETLISPDYKTYVYNIDLFVQNGSKPAGLNPAFMMPGWGTRGALTQQMIADVIAYIISLNK